MRKDWKVHTINNMVTLIGILLSIFFISYCMLFGERYHSSEKEKNEAFTLMCNIAVIEKDITLEQAENVIKGYKELACQASIKYAAIEDIGGEVILTSNNIKKGTDLLSPDCIEVVCEKINNGELCFVMKDSKSLQELYNKLAEICNNNGFEICVNEHKEINERHTAVIEKRLYILIRYGAMMFSAVFLFVSLFVWFDKRKHEWFIRNICGQSVKELLIESTKIILSFIVIAYIFSVLFLSIYKPSSLFNIMEYGFIGFIEAVICMILLSVKYSKMKR